MKNKWYLTASGYQLADLLPLGVNEPTLEIIEKLADAGREGLSESMLTRKLGYSLTQVKTKLDRLLEKDLVSFSRRE